MEKKNGYHLQNIGHTDQTFHVHILGAYVHVKI